MKWTILMLFLIPELAHSLDIKSGDPTSGGVVFSTDTSRLSSTSTWTAAQKFSSITVAGNLTVQGGSVTAQGGVSAASFTINGTSLFVSSFSPASPTSCDGCVLRYTTGTINANTSITVAASDYGAVTIHAPKCGMIEQVNTATTGVRIKSLANLPTSFTCYNPDAVNNQGYWAEFWLRY